MSCSISVIGDFIDVHLNGGGKKVIGITRQLCESAAAFGNAIVNVVLCCFYDGKKKKKKNAVVKVFTYAVFFSGFTVLLIISEKFDLVYN